jgi:hypothetical protein
MAGANGSRGSRFGGSTVTPLTRRVIAGRRGETRGRVDRSCDIEKNGKARGSWVPAHGVAGPSVSTDEKQGQMLAPRAGRGPGPVRGASRLRCPERPARWTGARRPEARADSRFRRRSAAPRCRVAPLRLRERAIRTLRAPGCPCTGKGNILVLGRSEPAVAYEAHAIARGAGLVAAAPSGPCFLVLPTH